MSKSPSPAQTPSTATESVAGDLAEAGAGSGSAAEAGVGSEPKRTRRGRPGYDRETLINKATEVFVSRGYDGTSMDTVARELGITKSAIYHHVKSKEELLRLAINRGTDALASAVESESHREDLSALDRLRHAKDKEEFDAFMAQWATAQDYAVKQISDDPDKAAESVAVEVGTRVTSM